MGGKSVDFAEHTSVERALVGQIAAEQASLENLKSAESNIIAKFESGHVFSGTASDGLKNYLGTIHSKVIEMIVSINDNYENKLTQFSKAFSSKVDNESSAIIVSDYLEDQKESIITEQASVKELHDSLKEKLTTFKAENPIAFHSSISVYSSNIGDNGRKLKNQLDDTITDLESFDATATSLFSDVDAQINEIIQLIASSREQIKIGPGFTFSTQNNPFLTEFNSKYDKMMRRLEEDKVKDLFSFVDEDGKADAMADYINSLANKPDKLAKELELLERILQEMGSYDSLSATDKEKYKQMMSYLQLLKYYQSSLNYLDDGYAVLKDLTYKDGEFSGKVDVLSPEFIANHDKNSRPDQPSIGELMNGIPFNQLFFTNLDQWADHDFNNINSSVDFKGSVADHLAGMAFDQYIGLIPFAGQIWGALGSVGDYYVAKEGEKWAELEKRYKQYTAKMGFEIYVTQTGNQPPIFICVPSDKTIERINWLAEIANKHNIESKGYLDDKGNIRPDKAYQLYMDITEIYGSMDESEKTKYANFFKK